MPARILVIDHRVPRPDEDSGSVSILSYLQILSHAGFDVTFVPHQMSEADRYVEAIFDLGVHVATSSTFLSAEEAVYRFAPHSDLVILYRAPVAERYYWLVRDFAPRAKVLFHAVDLHHVRTARQAALSGSAEEAREAERLRTIELELVARADATIVVSAREREVLREAVPDATVHHVPILREAPPVPGVGYDPQARKDIVFVGGFEHTPNGDAVHWFVSQVWPRVVAAGVSDRLVIAGSNMPPDITALAAPSIAPLGHVRDLAALFARARMSIAPLRYGAGVKGKIVSSLSHGLPVVATSIAAEGMALVHEKNVLIADDPGEMADAIVRLSRDDDLWRRLSAAGRDAFMRDFSHEAGQPKVLGVVEALIGG